MGNILLTDKVGQTLAPNQSPKGKFIKMVRGSIASELLGLIMLADTSGIGEKLARAEEPKSPTSIIVPSTESEEPPLDDRYYNKKGFNLVKELSYMPGTASLTEGITGTDIVGVLMKKFKNIREWDQKTFTAPVMSDKKKFRGVGYLNNIDELAWASLIKSGTLPDFIEQSNDIGYILLKKFRDGKYSVSLPEIEKFAEIIKSGRLASMIAAATLAGYPIQDADLAKTVITADHEIKLSLVAEEVNKRLGIKYDGDTASFIPKEDRVEPRHRAQAMENAVLEFLYGKIVADKLIEASQNDNYGRKNEEYPKAIEHVENDEVTASYGWLDLFAEREFGNKE